MGAVVSEMIEQSVVISGIGQSAIGRRLGRDPWSLTADACLAAIADAGLGPDAIDGISTYPGASGTTPGLSGAGADDVRSLLGLKTRWHNGGTEMPGQLGSLINAVLAVGSGLCDHVLCFRTVWESTAQTQIGDRAEVMKNAVVREHTQWVQPYGLGYPSYGALWTQRFMYETGLTREQLAQVAITCRNHAVLNPDAIYRTPMKLDDYMSARMISDPVCLYDCDVPADGAIAFVVSRRDSGEIRLDKAINIAAIGSAVGYEACARMLWSRTKFTPQDVRMAQLYDGFSIIALLWLQALGLAPGGDVPRFIADGGNIALDGSLPFNTNGGQLSGGRLHGFGGLLESCLQLRGEAGERQIRGNPAVAITTSGAEAFTSALLLNKA